jgi:phosphate starvation-inducible PhoH-like protein
VDLPRNTRSGLRNVIEVLRGVEGISFTFFTARDVVRHPLVAKIVRAYEKAEEGEVGSGDRGPGTGNNAGTDTPRKMP